ncbi:telomeric repeat binding factor 1, putative [Plasmodium gallinaceum]|uniref:Telomeric repeat binding factor 1, putative n=1 Tax=Plasmodium gallinaceum TaxID=5849 RepID=A0A1J1GW65_PLAGA|nr:telomeric repeat binding factor 1, putative [Plasmodium gallinaceum]CRG96795.1 telomeric repeat binding factor 1, putative [Plasmodium gallinaceum]
MELTDIQLLKIKSSIFMDEDSSPILIDTNKIKKKDKKKKEKIKYKTRVKWTQKEIELLINGINTYGLSNWSKIMNSYSFPEYRTNTSLKDKYRNFKKVFIIEKD